MPIMVGSEKCNIADFEEEEFVEIGEDPADPGGYFIVNGSERVLMTSEDLAPNKILAEYDTKYGDEIQVAKTFSQRRGYRALVLCRAQSREASSKCRSRRVSGSVNFVTLVRALGLESDEEIVHRVSDDPEIVKFMLENLEAAEVQTEEEAIETLGKRVASGQGKNYQLKRANYVIDRYLLPHLHEEGVEEEEVRINKAYYLCADGRGVFRTRAGPPRLRRQGPLRQQAAEGLRRPDEGPVPDGAEQAGTRREVPARTREHAQPAVCPSTRWFGPTCSPSVSNTRSRRELGRWPLRGLAVGRPDGLHGCAVTPSPSPLSARRAASPTSRRVTCTRPSGVASARPRRRRGRTVVW